MFLLQAHKIFFAIVQIQKFNVLVLQNQNKHDFLEEKNTKNV